MKIFQMRIRDEQWQQIQHMMQSEVTSCESVAEFYRLLVQREWNRRRRLPKPKPAEWQSAFRSGRPVNPKSKRQMKKHPCWALQIYRSPETFGNGIAKSDSNACSPPYLTAS